MSLHLFQGLKLVNTSQAQMGYRYQFISPAEGLQMSFVLERMSQCPFGGCVVQMSAMHPCREIPISFTILRLGVAIGFHDYTYR